MLTPSNLSPELPTFSDEQIENCTKSRDFRPILFEWFKYVGLLCNLVACISPSSPALRKIPPVNYAVLTGLLNRCSRLMLSNTRLSSTRKYGETTHLIDRCISESAIKVQWLCHNDDPEFFKRYLADGLKNDLRLKKQILDSIKARNNHILVIEQRMLSSIQKCIDLSELSEQEVNNARKLPNFAEMCNDLGLDDIFYTAVQRMGSHAVHGTWSELVFNYLQYENGGFYPRDHDVDTQDVQFIAVIHHVVSAIEHFLNYVVSDCSEKDDFTLLLKTIRAKITEIPELAWASDFYQI